MRNLVLRVNGRDYAGWEGVSVKRSVSSLTGTFALNVSDRFSDINRLERIGPDDECVLLYKDQVLINGEVDEIGPTFDAQTRSMAITGRDRTRNIVDCSAVVPSQTLTDLKLDAACTELCSPYGVEVVTQVDVGAPFGEFSIDSGNTVFEAIEARARQRGVLLTTDNFGRLVLGEPSRDRLPVALRQGQNIKAASARKSSKDRFGKYSVVAQRAETADTFGEAATALIGVAKDSGAKDSRHKLIRAEKASSPQDCVTRALWERNIAIARSVGASATVHGWDFQHHGVRHMWRENRIVKVESDWLGINEDMFVEGVEYVLDEQSGEECIMNLVRPWTLTPQPEVIEVEDSL